MCVWLYIWMAFLSTPRIYQHTGNMILQGLRVNGLYAKTEKCLFEQPWVAFLGHIASKEGLSMDLKKVATITN